MNRLASDSTNPSSTTSNIKRYIANTQLSDITSLTSNSDNIDHSELNKSTPAAINVAETDENDLADAAQQDVAISELEENVATNELPSKYRRNLKYLPNMDFLGDFTKLTPGNSATNTFNYKSHPNAKTKSSFTINDENHPLHSLHEVTESPPMKTSTILMSPQNESGAPLEHAGQTGRALAGEEVQITPDWIPKELDVKWHEEAEENADFSSSVRINKQFNSQPPQLLDFEFPSGSNTMIHNKNHQNKLTPMWQRVQKNSQPNFHDIFLSQSDKAVNDSHEANAPQFQNHSLSSTMSTPMGTMKGNQPSTNNHNNHDNNTNLTKIDRKNAPGNPESPLKLFADNYNTYTKEKLNGVLKKVNDNRSAQQTPQALPNKKAALENPVSLQKLPQPRIHEFTKNNEYTDQQFIQNANQIFNHIQRKGFRIPDEINQNSTATSTPKPNKIHPTNLIHDYAQEKESTRTEDMTSDEYTSYESNDEEGDVRERIELVPQPDSFRQQTQNEYTSFDNSSRNMQNTEISHSRNQSEFTFDEISSDENEFTNLAPLNQHNQQLHQRIHQQRREQQVPHQYDNERESHQQIITGQEQYLNNQGAPTLSLVASSSSDELNELRAKINSLEQENNRLKHGQRTEDVSAINIDDLSNSFANLNIKLKHASQLKLNEAKVVNNDEFNSHHIVRGRVRPDTELPNEYGNMILDEKNQRWILIQDKENEHGSLDSIEDLETSEEQKNQSILRPKDARAKNLEVSFDLRDKANDDITGVADLHDVTFSQSRKRLVSVVTDVLSRSDLLKHKWNQIKEITLSDYQLHNINDLNKFLPNLSYVDLSRNSIQYLEGLPKNILNLNISENNIDNLTSFGQFHDLQYLNISSNHLTSLSNIRNNIHITELNVSNNELTNLKGIEKLSNLTKLNLSQNRLMGEVDLTKCNLPHLEVLNLSENSIQSVIGIENLPQLRILDLNENQLIHISCTTKHRALKKLVVKLNNLKKLNLEPFPHLRTLRIDGNNLNVITDMKRLKQLQELSMKCQSSSNIVENIIQESTDIINLDLSGNVHFDLVKYSRQFDKISSHSFLSLTKLVLTAMNLTSIPDSFTNLYPNIRELNLNFNRIDNIKGLAALTNLRKLYLVSNNITKTEAIITGLSGSRNTLKVLDLRLNPCNVELYPYVFNPTELDLSRKGDSPVHLETLDEIESFAIHYEALHKTADDWEERNTEFVNRISHDKRGLIRNQYELLFINYFHNIVQLDGTTISDLKRSQLNSSLRQSR